MSEVMIAGAMLTAQNYRQRLEKAEADLARWRELAALLYAALARSSFGYRTEDRNEWLNRLLRERAPELEQHLGLGDGWWRAELAKRERSEG